MDEVQGHMDKAKEMILATLAAHGGATTFVRHI